MNAAASFVTGEREEDDSWTLSAAGVAGVASFINWCIAEGREPPAVHLEQLSPHDQGAERHAPAHRPGVRWFRLLFPASEHAPAMDFFLGVHDDPASDRMHISRSQWLAAAYNLEQQGGLLDGLSHDMAHADTRRTLLGAMSGRETAQALAESERALSRVSDNIRATAADPGTWAPIEPTACFFGTVTFHEGGAA